MFQLSESDRQLLLTIARQSILDYLSGRVPHLPAEPGGPLAEKRGAFVSLHLADRLRGCMGNIHPAMALIKTVSECAITAAVGDPRFLPITREELEEADLEVSVLSPLEPVEDLESIVPGRDGLLISKGAARGLLLPQVATQYGWDRERFLAETCRKAGLHPNDWKSGATVYRFTVDAFAEEKRNPSQL
jgi:AmmeMemoRadiSam system protein A